MSSNKSVLTDVSNIDTLEIVIREDGKVVWVNTEVCYVFRARGIKNLIIDDRRKK